MTSEARVLRQPEEFSPRLVRVLAASVARAVRLGSLHHRPPGWVEQVVAAGEARAVLRADLVLGFFTVRPVTDIHHGDIVYGGACLWRTSNPDWERSVHEAVLRESVRLGSAIYGSYFTDNADAAQFYSEARDWQRISTAEFPDSMRDIVAAYLDRIVLVRRRFLP